MAGTRNPDAVQIFEDAAVYVGVDSAAPRPATINDPLGARWANAGVLNGDAGITNERGWDETEHFGWGIGLYRVGRKNYTENRVFTCLEKNKTTTRLAHPGSSASQIVVPRPLSVPLCFEYTDDRGNLERWFTARPADCWIPNLDRNESDPTGREVTARIFATGDGLLYVRQYTPINEVQELTFSAAPATGDLTLELAGVETAPITAPITAANVQAALEAIAQDGGTIAATGNPTAGIVVTLGGTYAGETNELIVVATNTLEDAGAEPVTVTVAEGTAP